ncbi:MAG: EamA family transporter, partial [Clostridia bacterium]|nr:EamA family transporter [Clostridia bacterium]
MGILLLLLFVACQQGESITVKTYGQKHSVGGMLFNAIICLAATLFFFIADKDGLTFTKELVLWGIGSCLLFATGFFGSFMAYRYGSYIATKLVNSFSVVISIFYGIFFLEEKAALYTYIAVVLFFASVFLINYKKTEGNDKKSFSVKWLAFILLSAVSNGFISIIMREQQLRFGSSLDNE